MTPDSEPGEASFWRVPRDHGRRADARPARLASGLNVLMGLWLAVSPWVLRYSSETAATWNQVAVGALVVLLAGARAARPRSRPEVSWANLAAGVWVAVAPFVLVEGRASGDEAVYVNAVVTGLVVVLLSAFSAAVTHVDRSAAGDGD